MQKQHQVFASHGQRSTRMLLKYDLGAEHQIHSELFLCRSGAQDRAELATEEYLPVTPGTILEAGYFQTC